MRARKPAALLDENSLYDYAVRLLGQQMRTVSEMKRLMRRRVEPGEEGEAKMEAVVARLKERHYLDDASYAQDYTRLRQENASFGKRRVQQDLMRKGVHATVIGNDARCGLCRRERRGAGAAAAGKKTRAQAGE